MYFYNICIYMLQTRQSVPSYEQTQKINSDDFGQATQTHFSIQGEDNLSKNHFQEKNKKKQSGIKFYLLIALLSLFCLFIFIITIMFVYHMPLKSGQNSSNKELQLGDKKDIFNRKQNIGKVKNKVDNGKIYKRTVFNQQYIGKRFGQTNKSIINLTNYMNETKDVWKSIRVGETKSQLNAIYVLTPTDLNKLVKKIDFWKYKQQLLNQIPYQVIEFDTEEKNSSPLPQLQYTSFKTDQEIENYIKNLMFTAGQKIQTTDDVDFHLAAQSFFHPDDQQLLEAELYYFNKKYNINSLTRQLPICIWTAQYNIFSKKQYKQYFDSIERLNYTNYHIVYTDDKSIDGSAEKVYELVNTGKYNRIKDRLKIIRNLQSVGGLGNMYFWTQKFCNENDIVINIDADDGIVGTQSFKILSSVYEQQNIWYVYSKHLDFDPSNSYTKRGFGSQKLQLNTGFYRRERKFITSHIRTFRLKLMKLVPIYQLIDFHYNTTTKIAWPTFQSLAFDTAQVYAHFELAGNQRIKFIPEYLYVYFGSAGTRKCYSMHQKFDQLKNSIKTPLRQVNSLEQKGRQVEDTNIDEQLYIQPNFFSQMAISEKCYLP